MTRLSDSYRSGVTDALASVKLAVDFTSGNPLRWSSYTAPHADAIDGHLSNAAAALKRVGPDLGYGALGAATLYGLYRLSRMYREQPVGAAMPYNDPTPQDSNLQAYLQEFR